MFDTCVREQQPVGFGKDNSFGQRPRRKLGAWHLQARERTYINAIYTYAHRRQADTDVVLWLVSAWRGRLKESQQQILIVNRAQTSDNLSAPFKASLRDAWIVNHSVDTADSYLLSPDTHACINCNWAIPLLFTSISCRRLVSDLS